MSQLTLTTKQHSKTSQKHYAGLPHSALQTRSRSYSTLGLLPWGHMHSIDAEVGENMSEEMSMFGQAGVHRDSAHPGHREIPIGHGPQTSIDELLKAIKGANGMPVLFVPTSDGRLTAVAVNGLQSLMAVEKKEQEFRSWLLFLTSLVATVTFTAGLTPPGGFWADDNDGHIAGTPIMQDKFRARHDWFQYCNKCAFFTSLMITASLARYRYSKTIMTVPFSCLVVLCFVSLGSSFVTGTWDSNISATSQLTTVIFILALNIVYMTWDQIKEEYYKLCGSLESGN